MSELAVALAAVAIVLAGLVACALPPASRLMGKRRDGDELPRKGEVRR